MQKHKGWWTLVGFLLFILGFSAVSLSMVGVQLSFLTWIDYPGVLIGFVIKILMILVGLIIVVLARSSWDGEESANADESNFRY